MNDPMIRFLSLTCLLALASPGGAQLVISEFMAANRAVQTDRDGYSSDWIEIYNANPLPVDLKDFYLTNSKKDPRRWQFPGVKIPGRGFLVVHASGKDRRVPSRPLHTNFRLSRGGDSLTLYAPDGETVVAHVEFGRQFPDVSQGYAQEYKAELLLSEGESARYLVPSAQVTGAAMLDFDDRNWSIGRGPFGFDKKRVPTLRSAIQTDVEVAMRGVNPTIYYRMEFEVIEPQAFDLAVLRIRYESGFAAFLNGREIARRRTPSRLDHDAEADVGLEPRDPFNSEYFAIPHSQRESVLRPGKNVLFVQGLVESVNSLEHFLAAQIIGYAASKPNVEELLFLDVATPGRPNGRGASEVVAAPRLEPAASLFVEPVSATVTCEAGDTIRYTTDGTDPDHESPVYTGPIRVETTTEVRTRAFREGARPSGVRTAMFTQVDESLHGFDSNLPLVVVTTFGRPIEPKVFTSAHAQFIERGGDARTALGDAPDFDGPIGIKTRGSSTLDRPKKGYGVELRDSAGEERASELFGMPADTHWVLYAPHNFDQSHIRNGVAYELARRMGLDSPRFRFCEVFVNHENRPVRRDDYVGLYLLVERISRGKHRVDVEKLTPRETDEPAITGGYILKIDRPGPGDMGFTSEGQRLQYVYPKERHVTEPQRRWLQRYFDAFGRAIAGDDSADPVKGYLPYVDLENWIDYHFFNEYTKNPDAYTLSTYLHKPRGGKIRMGPVWDYDRAMRTNDEDYWVGRPSRPTGWTGDCYYSWWGMLFRDPAFRLAYRKRGREWLVGEVAIERIHAMIDAMAAEVAEAEERDRLRWPIIEAGGWNDEIIDLKEWLSLRTDWFRDELVEVPEFTESDPEMQMPFTVTLRHGNETGTLYYTTDGADPRLSDRSVSPRARVYDGPITVAQDTSIRARVKVGDTWSRMTDRWYVQRLHTLAVTEIMYNPQKGGDYEFVEFTNFGDEPIPLAGIRVTGGIRFHFGMGSVESLAPGERIVIVRDRIRFADRYDTTQFRVAGEYLGRFSNTEGEIVVYGSVGEELARAGYRDVWYPEADAGGHSLEVVEVARTRDQQAHWRLSAEVGGTPGR